MPRAYLEAGGEVLIGGRRRALAGTGDDGPAARRLRRAAGAVRAGDEVVLIGDQGGEEITAAEWAERLGTIAYEVLCGIGPRVRAAVVGGSPGRGNGHELTAARRAGRASSRGRMPERHDAPHARLELEATRLCGVPARRGTDEGRLRRRQSATPS